MQITVVGRHFEVTEAVRKHTTAKVEHLVRLSKSITKIEALLKNEDKKNQCELIISIKNSSSIVINVDHDDMYAAIDLAVDKADVQLRRHKEKVSDHHRGGGAKAAGAEE